MKKIHLISMLFVLTINFTTSAQTTDFGTWLGVNLNSDITKRLSADFDAELRMFDTLSRIDDALLEGGVKYNLIKHIDLIGLYRYSRSYDQDWGYYNENRLTLGSVFWIKPGRFKLYLQEKLQFGFKQIYQGGLNVVETRYLRSKFSISYNWPKSKINPFTSVEMFYDFSKYNDHEFDKIRCKAGIDYAINKKMDFSAYIQYQSQINAKTNDGIYIIGLTFSYKLPSFKPVQATVSED